jgi:hypothetical protein
VKKLVLGDRGPGSVIKDIEDWKFEICLSLPIPSRIEDRGVRIEGKSKHNRAVFAKHREVVRGPSPLNPRPSPLFIFHFSLCISFLDTANCYSSFTGSCFLPPADCLLEWLGGGHPRTLVGEGRLGGTSFFLDKTLRAFYYGNAK